MRRLAWLVGTLVFLGSCSGVATDGAFELFDGRIDGPSSLAAGARSIEIQNMGGFEHTLVITDAEGGVVAATGLVEPGATTSLSVDLAPGTYVFSCRIVVTDEEGNLLDHFEMGMHETVRVSG